MQRLTTSLVRNCNLITSKRRISNDVYFANPPYDRDKVLVVKLNWLGCGFKQSFKYNLFWMFKLGMPDILESTPELSWLSLFPSRYEKEVRMMLPEIDSRTRRNNPSQALFQRTHRIPIVFHVLSNNGFYFYQALLRELFHPKNEKAWKHIRILGCVVDSAPSLLTPNTLTRGTTGVLTSQINSYWMNYDHPKIAPWVKSYYEWRLKQKRYGSFIQGLNNTTTHLVDPKLNWPHLFLYSSGDSLIGPEEVKSHIQMLRDHNITVDEHDFKDSEHVQHMRKHPEEYYKQINDFLVKRCQINSHIPIMGRDDKK